MKPIFAITLIVALSGCATIVNDPYIPLAVSFSDGSTGQCHFKNKRGAWSSQIPATNIMIRRSDDALVYNCTTEDEKILTGSIQSEIEGDKLAASVIFWDLGITDSITDKHRIYQGNIVIPVDIQDAFIGEKPTRAEESEPAQEKDTSGEPSAKQKMSTRDPAETANATTTHRGLQSEALSSQPLPNLDADLIFLKAVELNHYGKAQFQSGRSLETRGWSCTVMSKDENLQFIPKGTTLNIIDEKHLVEYGGTMYDCLSVFSTDGLVKKITCKTSCDPYGHEYQLERQHLPEVLGSAVQQAPDAAPKSHSVQMPGPSYDEQSFMEFAVTIFQREKFVEARKKCEVHDVSTQTDAFLACQERQVKENPDSPEAQYLLGVGYVYAGKNPETWKQYEILKSMSVNFSKLLLDVIVHVRPELLQRQ